MYVKDFPKGYQLDNDGFKKMFEPFGVVSSVAMFPDTSPENNGNAGYGFLCFEDPSSAEKLITDGLVVNGQKLHICRALSKEQREKELKKKHENYKKSLSKLNLIVKNIPDNTTQQ